MPGPMLRLPSAAVRQRLQSVPSSRGDESPASSPGSSSPIEATPAASMMLQAARRGSHSVHRSRFFLEHEGPAARLRDTYELERRPLGEGGFGTVCRARLRGTTDVVRAVKAIRRRGFTTEVMVQKEVAILRSLDHPYICRLFETFYEEKCVYLVMEYVDGQELFDYIQQSLQEANVLNEDFAAQVMKQVFSALHYCHVRSVVHRDLKPENIMVQRASAKPAGRLEIKLIDFGLAVFCERAKEATEALAGTQFYLAPEARRGAAVSPAWDLWSSGVVLHAMLLGGLPPEAVRAGELRLEPSQPELAGLSPAAGQLLAGLLRARPSERLTAAEAMACRWLGAEARAAVPPQQLSRTMDAFSSFHRSDMLRRAVLTALAIQLANQHTADLRAQFLSADGDGNGRISRSELASSIAGGAMAAPEGVQDVQAWVESVFDSVDTDGSDEIEYTEWLAAALHEGEVRSDQAIKAAFRVFDVDGSGKISQQEIARVTAQAPADIANLMPQVDLDGDGEVSFEEFRTLIRKSPALMEASPKRAKVDGASLAASSLDSSSPSLWSVAGVPAKFEAMQRWCSLQWQSLSHSAGRKSSTVVAV